MALLEPSNKLSQIQREYRVCSKPYVFHRVIGVGDEFRFMTATASEDTGSFRAYEDQSSLINATIQALQLFDLDAEMKLDHAGRPYVETIVSCDKEHLLHVAQTALREMGFEDVSILALDDMLSIYDQLAVGDDGEDVYLSDGMWITSDGLMIEK